jgi:hypothetical protein
MHFGGDGAVLGMGGRYALGGLVGRMRRREREGTMGESTSESLEWNPIYVDAYQCADILY